MWWPTGVIYWTTLWSWWTLVIPAIFIYLFSKNSPAVSPWGYASGECLLFVVTDQRRPSCAMCDRGWLGAVQLRCCVVFLGGCVLNHWMPPSHSLSTPCPSPPPPAHVPATRGWVDGQLLQWWDWVKLQTSSNKHRDRKNKPDWDMNSSITSVGNIFSQNSFCNHPCFFYLIVSGFHCQRFSSCGKVE